MTRLLRPVPTIMFISIGLGIAIIFNTADYSRSVVMSSEIVFGL